MILHKALVGSTCINQLIWCSTQQIQGEKSHDGLQYPSLHDQIPKETRTKRNMPSIIKKKLYDKPIENITLIQKKKKKSISPKIQWGDGYHCLSTLLQNSAQRLSKSNTTRGWKKKDTNKKEWLLFLFADYMILYLLYTDYTTRKLLDLLFIQQSRILFISGHKVSIQKWGLGAGEIAHWVKHLPCNCEDQSWDSQNPHKSWAGMRGEHL